MEENLETPRTPRTAQELKEFAASVVSGEKKLTSKKEASDFMADLLVAYDVPAVSGLDEKCPIPLIITERRANIRIPASTLNKQEAVALAGALIRFATE